ncbi:MAG: carbamate kinase, partial [Candidatus Adiutrix sp.]|nr:carbamate kinase [Candidatus Adiutrix sp.]
MIKTSADNAANKQKLAVIAIGGNALSPDPAHLSLDRQHKKAEEAAEHIADLMLDGWNVVLSHGNGPQIGLMLRRSELARDEVPPMPMEYAGATTQGVVGYMLCQALRNAFIKRDLNREPVAVVTQTLVDERGPAFADPVKPIGGWFSEERARALERERGWRMAEDSGRGWRRLAPSPEPVKIVELEAIRRMVGAGLTVIAVGGGGLPVVQGLSGRLSGVDAVIDKDRSAALLAAELKADMLILPTAVEKVAVRFGQPDQKWLDH